MYKIAVLPGDGTGPEVVVEGLKALEAVAAKQGFKYETVDFDFGSDRYLETGEVLPDSAADDFRAFHEVGAADYPDIKRDYAHIEAICMWMVKNPEWFDVIVTDNIFGDIITDLGAMIQGGMGIAAGGNINPEGVSMFEPIGGSAPKYTGQNIINPMAAIGAAQLMLDTLGEHEGAKILEGAIVSTLARLDDMSAGKMGYSTSDVGDLVAQAVADA